MRNIFFALVIVLSAPSFALAALPETTQMAERSIPLSSQAVREKFFVNLYRLGFYLPQQASASLSSIRDPGIAKAIKVEVLYDGSLPDKVPQGWQNELAPAMSQTQSQKLKNVYRQLQPSDTITINYKPERGTWIEVNGRTVMSDSGHGLMDAYIDIWLGDNPVSESLKKKILS